MLLAAVMVILALFASACGSDDDTDANASGAAVSNDQAGGDTGGNAGLGAAGDDGDAEGGLVAGGTTGDDSSAEEFSGDDGMADDGAMMEDDSGDAEAGLAPAATPTESNLDSYEDTTANPSRTNNQGDGFFDESVEAEPVDQDTAADIQARQNGYRVFVDTDNDPESTFALDVDTGAYSLARRLIQQGQRPPVETVRVEEYVNAFDYDYDNPDDGGLGLTVDGGPSPLNEDNYLVRIGVQAERVSDRDRPDAHLTFVVDTSGSMDREDRLGLVKESLLLLVDQLDRSDTVAIVTYSESSGVILEPTRVSDRDEIIDAIEGMSPGGSTNLESGLRTGYDLASEVYEEGDINRVILASDGIANVGATSPEQLAQIIRPDADRGIQLVTIGYGMQGFNDEVMEQVADQGDGFYAYVDTIDEAERLFEDELTSTLLTMAIDAKIQVVFNEDVVESYRLIGFENRAVRDEDFRNDDVDAGELGAGHQVTAIYEVEFTRGVDIDDVREELGEVHLRWEDPDSRNVIEIDELISMRDLEERWSDTDETFRLAATVAVWAELLRDSPYAEDVSLDQVLAEAESLADDMRGDDIEELVDLISASRNLR